MFEKLKRNLRLRELEINSISEHDKIRYCKAELYDIEHDSCLYGKDWIIKNYGSMDAYKQELEDWIKESKKKLEEYWTEEKHLRDS